MYKIRQLHLNGRGPTDHILLLIVNVKFTIVNEFCRVAGILRFTMVKFALVSCIGNSGNMKRKL